MGWNGVEFSAPSAWAPASFGPRYLLFDDGNSPALEIKWERITGVFSHRRHLKKLGPGRSAALEEITVPESWEAGLERFQATAFAWRDARGGQGLGVVLFCPDCRNALLLQFLGPAVDNDDLQARLLSSLTDHSSDGSRLWAVYDIRARVPEALAYQSALFQPGRFELTFGLGKSRIRLIRWSPASVLLKKGGLEGFGTTCFPWSVGCWKREDEDGLMISAEKRARGLERLKAVPRHRWAGLWFVAEANRIMGVSAESRRPLDKTLLDGLCSEFHVVPPE